jgi:hypothetical protein
MSGSYEMACDFDARAEWKERFSELSTKFPECNGSHDIRPLRIGLLMKENSFLDYVK